ncbi:extracellular calcium-sensing receptor-like [Rana temporaria]|uniref:extracellular calcium-sensing receptor-like n=1 Tax=Rana temporaria TaxID=8407 RepID=UPI001AACA8EE|nr:extracellular calcium-sensing receptor-like [Rana temporaria]
MAITRRLLQVFLLLSWLDEVQSSPSCSLQGWPMDTLSQFGNILIGAVFVVHSGFIFHLPTFQEEPKPVSCTGFHIRYYRDVLGLMFAVDEINNSPDLLPNITLGFSFVDSCMSELRAVGGVLSLLSGLGNPFPGYDCHAPSVMVGIVGEHFSALSLPIAQMLGALHYPQISHGATLSALSNKMNFPSFFRTMPSNLFQNIALIQLVGQFGWTWVGMLVVDNDVGQQGAQIIQAGIERNGGCVAFLEKIHLSYSTQKIKRVVDVIKRSSVNVIVLHSQEVHVKALLDAMFADGVTGKIFISSASFIMTPGLFSKKAWKVLNGTIGLVPSAAPLPGFEEFLLNLHPNANTTYPFIRLFWEKAFSCYWPVENPDSETSNAPILKEDVACTGEEGFRSEIAQLFETNDLSLTYHAYLAVYAYTHALHSLLGCPTISEGYFHQGVCSNINDAQPRKVRDKLCMKSYCLLVTSPPIVLSHINSIKDKASGVSLMNFIKVLRFLKKTNFQTKSGEVMKFNSEGDLPASYDIINIQVINGSFNLVKVGRIDPEAQPPREKISLNVSAILWNDHVLQVPISVCSNSCRPGYRKTPFEGRPICCYDCIPCSEGEITNYTDADECTRCPSDQWSNEERDRCIPKVIEFLSYNEPLGIVLVIAVAMLSILTLCILIIFIKYQDTPIIKATNRELSYILLVSLILCFLCCLVFIGQPSKFSCLLRQTFFSVAFSISMSSVLAKTIMVILAFKATGMNSPLRKWLGPTIPRNVVGLCLVLQTSICSLWLHRSPPFPTLNNQNYKIIFECNEGQKQFFYINLGFMGFMAMVSFLVAFLARNLPGSFNEAKLITFSMLVFCCVWISFIPAYLSTSGKYTVAVQIFAILASSAGLLSCIFLPKCYIILLRPERNNRDFLSGNKKKRTF